MCDSFAVNHFIRDETSDTEIEYIVFVCCCFARSVHLLKITITKGSNCELNTSIFNVTSLT